jgi:DNA-binding MarR family transcriptional regulator
MPRPATAWGVLAKLVNMVNELAEQLRPVVMRLSRELRREVRLLGVTAGQVSLLFAINRNPGVGLRELAAHERMSPAAMSRHVGGLVALGLLRREGDPKDARRHALHVTAEGQRILRQVKSRRAAWLAVRLRTLSDEDLLAIRNAIAPLGRLVEAERA